MTGLKGVLGAAVMLACDPAGAQERPEFAVGVFEHGANFHPLGDRLIFDDPPPGIVYEGQEEDGTVDVQLVYRTAPLRFALKPRLTGKLQINTAGRTSFASVGAEWRQHAFRDRVYAQVGIGVTVHDGYRFTPDPFEPGLSAGAASRRYDIYLTRIAFGSRVLFNPNASLGVRLNDRWSAELAWEHFSHRQIFNEQNPGIDNVGLRLIRKLGAKVTVLLAALLVVQSGPAALPTPTPDAIVVRAQRLKRLKRLQMTARIDPETGVTACVFKRRSGDPALDAQVCDAVLACAPTVKTMAEMQACLAPTMNALTAGTPWRATQVR